MTLRLLFALLLPAAAFAAPSSRPVSEPAHLPADQPDAAFAGAGAVVVYRGPDAGGQARVWLRRLDADGLPVGGAEAVDAGTEAWASSPAVAAAADGAVAVAWLAGAAGEGAPRLRVYDAAGAAGPVREPAGASPPAATDVDVAALPGGGWVVVWSRLAATGQAFERVHAGVCAADGAFVSPVLTVSTDDAVYNVHPRAAGLPGGGFAVVWGAFDLATVEVHSRRFGPGGAAPGPERIQADEASFPVVAAAADGGLVLAWSATGARTRIGVRHLDPDGEPRGADAFLAVEGAGPGRAGAGCAPGGAGAVAWPPGGGTTAGDLQVAFFLPGGAPAGAPVVLTAQPADLARPAAVALDDEGRALAVWADAAGAVRAAVWTEEGVPARRTGWGGARGLYR